MKNIKDYDLEDLKKELVEIGEKPFRAEQIFKWLYQEKVKEFDEMTNLSLALREKLKENYTICNYKILRKQESKDGTIKYLFDVLDGNAIETVLMSYHHGYSICVSSQIGCKMGCKFCASTGINFIRSLTSGEIVEQILAVEQDTGVRISNVVFMGIGEPLNNYTNVVNAIRIINNPKGLNIGARHISVSTSGLVPGIYRLAEENIQLSPDEARAMGVHTDRLRLAVILCATVLTASAVSVSGMIGWVGLVIPHLSRRLVGNDCRRLLPMACLFGAAFLLLVDDLARTLAATEIPIGILTAFVGAPFFIYLMVKGGDRL